MCHTMYHSNVHVSYNVCFHILGDTVGAVCDNGDLRLVDGATSSEGRLEVCINDAWGSVCSLYWTNNEANVACGKLEYLSIGKIHSVIV